MRDYRIAGIVQFGSSSSLGGTTIAVFDLATAQMLFDKRGRLDAIQVAAAEGVTPEEVTREIEPLLPETARVRTAAAQAEAESEETRSGLGIIQYFLLAFGAIALFVGSFVIANTLSITVAQRVRELATLRTLGASRRQVLWSVVLEGAVIGLLASVIGLFLGLAIAVAWKRCSRRPGSSFRAAASSSRRARSSSACSSEPASRSSQASGPRCGPRECRRSQRCARGRCCRRRGSRASACPSRSVSSRSRVALLASGVFAGGLGTVARLLAVASGTLLLFLGVALRRAASRPAARERARLAGRPLRWHRRRAGARQRDAQPEPDGDHRGGADGRARARHLRVDPRPGPALLLQRLGGGAVRRRLLAQRRRRPLERGGRRRPPSKPTASRSSPPIRGDDARAFGEDVHVNGVEPDVTRRPEHGLARGLERHTGRARIPGRVRQGRVRGRARPRDRLADRAEDAYRRGAPAPASPASSTSPPAARRSARSRSRARPSTARSRTETTSSRS